MYICKCGAVFSEEDAVKVYDDPSPVGVGLPEGAYSYDVCPCCESDDFGEAVECPCCGEYHDYDDGILCKECSEGIAEELEEIRIRNGLTKDDFEQAVAEIFGW